MVTDLESGSRLLLEAPVALLALVEVLPPPTRLLLRHPFFFLSVVAAKNNNIQNQDKEIACHSLRSGFIKQCVKHFSTF